MSTTFFNSRVPTIISHLKIKTPLLIVPWILKTSLMIINCTLDSKN